MTDEIPVRIDTDNEAYPVLGISQLGQLDAGRGWLIPAKLWADLGAAYDAVDTAEMAVMRHVAETYPEARYVQSWVREHTSG